MREKLRLRKNGADANTLAETVSSFFTTRVFTATALRNLFSKRANVLRERNDLFCSELLAEGGHLSAAMLDGVNNSLVVYSLLPLRIGEVSGSDNLAVVISRPILPMALNAFLFEESLRFFSFNRRQFSLRHDVTKEQQQD